MIPNGESPAADAIGRRSWAIVGAAIAALIVAIAAAGVVALVQNDQVRRATEQALTFDIEVEDEGEDIQIAALNLRHLHNDIALDGPSDANLAAHAQGYADLLRQISELDDLGITDPRIAPAAALRDDAERYYDDFRSAVARFDEDGRRSWRRAPRGCGESIGSTRRPRASTRSESSCRRRRWSACGRPRRPSAGC